MKKKISIIIYIITVLLFTLPFLIKLAEAGVYEMNEQRTSIDYYHAAFSTAGYIFVILNLYTYFILKRKDLLYFNFLMLGTVLLAGFRQSLHYTGTILIVTSLILLFIDDRFPSRDN